MSNSKNTRDWELWKDREIVEELDSYWQKEIFQRQKDHARNALAAIRKADLSSKTLLDFGCGTGRYVPVAGELGFEYTGVDVTEEMLIAARTKFPEATFDIDDIFDSTRADGSFDVVMSMDVIVHLPEFERPFATLYRLASRYVVVKLCYLTRRKGIAGWLLADSDSYSRRNKKGFIEHFYRLRSLTRHINSAHHPEWIHTDVFPSGQSISPYQVVLVVGKPGAPRIG